MVKSVTQPRNLFRAPSLPVIQRPFALRRRPTITLSSGIIAEPMFAEIVTPRPETKDPPRHDNKVAAPRPKSEQYTKTEWRPASSLDTFRDVSHDEDTPLVNDAPSSEVSTLPAVELHVGPSLTSLRYQTRSLHRSSARRIPNGPNKWIPVCR